MNYCKDCKLACRDAVCPACGTNTRDAFDDDFCLLAELHANFGQTLESLLNDEHIPCVSIPYGTGVRSIFALDAEKLRLYVPYAHLAQARTVLDEFSGTFHDNAARDLAERLDMLNLNPRVEKKIRKSLKLNLDKDILYYCKDKIAHAQSVTDEGRITGCFRNGHYLFVKTDDATFVVNSETLEILSAKPTNR